MSHVILKDINIHYPVMQDSYMSIRRAFLRKVSGGKIYGQDGVSHVVHALKNISFELRDGDRVGLIGRNGAGKSTLLRTIGGFILPDSGHVDVSGSMTSLFSSSGGMDIERSGYDNIFLMGRLLGMNRGEMQRHVADIETFSELGEFLKMPIRSYSDGMRVRLGIAIVTCIHPDILVLDEAIGASDKHFIDKAKARAQTLYDRANIIVMASHSPGILQSLCNKAIWLDHGTIMKTGTVDEVLEAYNKA